MVPTTTDDREKLLDQFLAQPKAPGKMQTRTEFNIVIDTNAHLRKLAEPALKNAITDDVLHQQFDETYGASVVVRHIVVANPQEAMALRARLDAGEDFATLARRYSRNANSARVGGELPPFTINSSSFPENFKRVAFALKVGEVSDPVEADGAYHLIKLEKRNAPKAVKFEDVKESLRQDLQDKLVLEGVKQVRAKLAQQALEQLKINDPILKAEFQKRLDVRNQMIRDRDKIREEMEKERNKPAVPVPATTPASQPATVATQPQSLPATQPAPTATPAATAPVVKPVEKPPAPAASATQPVATAPAPAVTSRPAPTTRP
ncbi:MAG: peptidylprolyl isomerase [Tepidisphaeraceae bacterium]